MSYTNTRRARRALHGFGSTATDIAAILQAATQSGTQIAQSVMQAQQQGTSTIPGMTTGLTTGTTPAPLPGTVYDPTTGTYVPQQQSDYTVPLVLGGLAVAGIIGFMVMRRPRSTPNRRRVRRNKRRTKRNSRSGWASGARGSNWSTQLVGAGRRTARPGIDEPEREYRFDEALDEAPEGWPGVEAERGGRRRRRSSRRQMEENKLSAAQRRRLPKSVFVFPARRAWPLDKASRARDAVRVMRLGRVGSASDFMKIRNAIRRRYPGVWGEYGRGLTWEQVKRAKSRGIRARRTTRGAARRTTRRVAANRRSRRNTSRRGRVRRASQVPAAIPLSRRSAGSEEFGLSFMTEEGLPWGEADHRRTSRGKKRRRPLKFNRRSSRRNPRRSSGSRPKPTKFSELAVWESVARVRESGQPSEMAGVLPPGVAAKFKKLAPGLYKYGYGPKKGEVIVQFKNASLKGALTSTRIGAGKVHEYHWVVDNFDPKFPVVIRGIDDSGKSYFRVEEYAKKFERVPVMAKRASAAR